VGVWVLVVGFATVALLRSSQVGVPLRDPEGRMFSGRLASALVLLAALIVVDSLMRAWRRRDGSGRGPVGVLRDAFHMLRDKWSPERLVLALTGLLAYHLVYVCYRNLKSWVAFNQLRDEELLAVDRWLFLGHSPAGLLHDLLGQDQAAYVLMVVYKSFTYLVPLFIVGSLVFVDRIREGYVGLTSAMWVWILGVGSYYLLPSLGPFEADRADFVELPRTAITATQAEYLYERAYLLQFPGAGDAFASLGAFASLHVAYTCMVMLMLRYYGLRRASMVVGCYLAATIIATVYFGWHYVVDDIAGVLIAVLAVGLARVMVRPRRAAGPGVVRGELSPHPTGDARVAPGQGTTPAGR
jgi:membrane-associated phospholipid phosphatase